jgi:hypothetical protein
VSWRASVIRSVTPEGPPSRQRFRPESKTPLLDHRDDGPIAAMGRPIISAERRRIEPRRLASVEKEGITAAEAIAEETGKLIKAHPSFGDDEMHFGWAGYADPVARLAIG